MSFSEILIDWYLGNKRDLPWRKTQNPYFVWLSEIILQQTQVKQGLPYYEVFIEQFPTIFDLAKAKEVKVLKLWQGLGYYSRARNLHASAKYVVEKLNGKFPQTYKSLLQLKGVGDYTASAIASICFNEATAVVDGNVYRVLSRYFGIDTPINSTQGIKAFKMLAQDVMDKNKPATFNQAIMEFGAIQCTPKNPKCDRCPFSSNCAALADNRVQKLPVKLKKQKVKKRYFNFLVINSKDKKTILEKREGKGIWENLYQFPLIETNAEINYAKFLPLVNNNEIIKGQAFELLRYNDMPITHKLSHQHLVTTFWVVNINKVDNGIPYNKVANYPVPILIDNFLKVFSF